MDWRICRLVNNHSVIIIEFKRFTHRNQCCVQNGTLYEADSIIERTIVGCAKVTLFVYIDFDFYVSF